MQEVANLIHVGFCPAVPVRLKNADIGGKILLEAQDDEALAMIGPKHKGTDAVLVLLDMAQFDESRPEASMTSRNFRWPVPGRKKNQAKGTRDMNRSPRKNRRFAPIQRPSLA